MIINVDDNNFKENVLDFDGIVLVDFYADWCGPCKSFGPIFEEFSNEASDNIRCCKLNVDESVLSKKYKVMSIPTVILFKNGEVCDRFVGVLQKRDLVEFVNKNI